MKKSVFLIMLSAFVVCGCCQRTEKTVLCEPYVIEGLAEAPEFWKVRPSQVVDLCESVTVGRSEVIAHTPAGQPVYAYFYGEFNEPAPQTNWSAGNSSSAICFLFLPDKFGIINFSANLFTKVDLPTLTGPTTPR